MCKLKLSDISDQEAYERRLQDLSKMSLAQKKVQIVIIETDIICGAQEIRYSLADIPRHIEAFLAGKHDPIGEREIKYAKKVLAYEKGLGC